jgi:hypothetical protein
MVALLLLAAIRMDGGAFHIADWQPTIEPAAGWSSVFSVYAGDKSADVPPLIGTYSTASGELVFRPRFPLSPGVHVRAVFRPAEESEPIEAEFDIPRAPAPVPSTRVAHIYPSTDVLPANALKFYVYFSAPMSRGGSWTHLRLLRDGDTVVASPFLELDQELWDRENRRFTILIDPGRIKRGLASLDEAGPVLEAGHTYHLVVAADWLDGRGAPLVEEYRKSFRVVAADRTPPDPASWRVAAPRARTNDPVVIRFPRPLDYALLEHEIEIVPKVAGSVSVGADEIEWRFTPVRAWAAGAYQVVVHTDLEDLAGNRILRAFDIDTFDPISRRATAETVSIPLRIR